MSQGCRLCEIDGGRLVLRSQRWRLVHAQEPGFPGFYRLVWNAHAPELSDLAPADRADCLEVLVAIEKAMRQHLAPTKINLASLGNVVPHLHWHLVARFDWDSHFPAPIWAQAQREAPSHLLAQVQARLPGLEQDLTQTLSLLDSFN